MPLDDEPLAAAPDLAVLTGLSETDPKLALALRRASARFRLAVGHQVSEVLNDDVTLNGTGHQYLVLPSVPVLAVDSVLLDGRAVTDYQWSEDGLLWRAAGWGGKYRSVEIIYDHGYDPVPDEVSEAVLDAAAAALNTRPGVESASVGDRSVTYTRGGGVTVGWSRAVARYRVGPGSR